MQMCKWKIVTLGHGKKESCFSGPPSPKFAPAPIFFLFFFFLIRSKVTKYMPMVKKNMKIATFVALLHLLCGYNALNLTVTTVYLLAAVTFIFLETLMANQFAIQ